MRWLWGALPALTCLAMMAVICIPMLLNRKHGGDDQAASKEEVAALREEITRFQSERGSDFSEDARV